MTAPETSCQAVPPPASGAVGQAFQVRELSPEELDERFVEEWLALEARAVEANAYLSPHFVLPALRHLGAPGRVLVLAVHAPGAGPRLAALGVFRLNPGGRRFPLTHLAAFSSDHSFLTGLLVDAAAVEPALQALFRFLCRPGAGWHGVAFGDWRAEGPLGLAMRRTAQGAGARWHLDFGFQRATLSPGRLAPDAFEAALAACTGKPWRKKVQRLVEQGEVQWRLLRGPACDAAAVDRFLTLEDREWARQEGTSLRAAGQEPFFRELCQGFSRGGRLFITELVHQGEVIASTCNFVSGRAGFAFKIGWAGAFASLRPGLLNELLFLRGAREACADLEYVDSGTTAGSFIEKLWEDRVTLQSGLFATSGPGRLAARAWGLLRWLRRGLARLRARQQGPA